jgi:hypothetical protein
MLQAGLADDHAALRRALLEVGFVSPALLDRHGATIDAVTAIVQRQVAASRAGAGLFDFADRSLVGETRRHMAPILADRATGHVPPVETLFVQRKISGIALLCARMRAQVPLVAMASRCVQDQRLGSD